MGPVDNTPYLKRRHSLEEELYVSHKIRKTSSIYKCGTNENNKNLKRKYDSSSSGIGYFELCCSFPKRAKTLKTKADCVTEDKKPITTIEMDVNKIPSMKCSAPTDFVMDLQENFGHSTIGSPEFNCFNYWKSPIEDVGLDALLMSFSSSNYNATSGNITESKSEKMEVASESNNSQQYCGGENAMYNNFNYWKTPILPLDDINLF